MDYKLKTLKNSKKIVEISLPKSANEYFSTFYLLLSIYCFLLSTFYFLNPAFVFASVTDGTIDPSYKYAWGENLGWINFGCDGCNAHITNTAITGYAWSRQYGWINLAPIGGGVTNNCLGQIGGYGWSSNLGWINFTGATINSNGKFTGLAGVSGSQTGRISFDCDNCDVRTDWRQCSQQAQITPISSASMSREPKGFELPPLILSCNGADFSHDGYVNTLDFSIFLYFWGTKPPFKNVCVDINKDNKVNSVDFSIMISQWGKRK